MNKRSLSKPTTCSGPESDLKEDVSYERFRKDAPGRSRCSSNIMIPIYGSDNYDGSDGNFTMLYDVAIGDHMDSCHDEKNENTHNVHTQSRSPECSNLNGKTNESTVKSNDSANNDEESVEQNRKRLHKDFDDIAVLVEAQEYDYYDSTTQKRGGTSDHDPDDHKYYSSAIGKFLIPDDYETGVYEYYDGVQQKWIRRTAGPVKADRKVCDSKPCSSGIPSKRKIESSELKDVILSKMGEKIGKKMKNKQIIGNGKGGVKGKGKGNFKGKGKGKSNCEVNVKGKEVCEKQKAETQVSLPGGCPKILFTTSQPQENSICHDMNMDPNRPERSTNPQASLS